MTHQKALFRLITLSLFTDARTAGRPGFSGSGEYTTQGVGAFK
jgi:hypothetical protein